jgi:hypothetical protein
MISANTATLDLLKKGSVVSTSAGATIEYNLNTMVEYITATSDALENTYEAAFKKLFPIDTIYKPFRPLSPGIKYLVHTNGETDTPANTFEKLRNLNVGDLPRLYYPGPDMVYKYWLAPKNKDISISLEYFSNEAKTTPKLIPTNKIVARFETSHDTPKKWTITVVKEDNATTSISGTSLVNGEAVIYYNGSTWYTSATEPTTYTGTQKIKKILLSAETSNTNKLIGVIELTPRWVRNLDSDIISFLINKETTADDSSVVPVGVITANYLSLSIMKPHTTIEPRSKSIVEYDRFSTEIDDTKIYLFKNAIIRPYINIGTGSSTPQKIFQGFFYITSWNLSEFGEATIDATDAAKILQDTMCPQMLVEDSPVTSIIKRVLDSVGFSTYKINVKTKTNSSQVVEADDNSIPTLQYWWSDGDKTVWDVLQELCRDIQMNAFVSESNILNFYSRDFMYDKTQEPVWTFTSKNIDVAGNLSYAPNIQSLTTKELFSANQVRVRYATAFTSTNNESSSPLWKSDTSFLGAGALSSKIELNSTDFELNPNVVIGARVDKIMDQFSGYVLINGEIIEYDGVYYQYMPLGGTVFADPVLIKSQSDIWKYSALAKPGYENFQALNKYNIKTRGAFGTSPGKHEPSPASYINEPGQTPSTDKFDLIKGIVLATPDLPAGKASPGSYYIPEGQYGSKVKKGFLTVSNLDKDKKTFDMAIKEFSSINTSANYFAFGTRFFFESQLNTAAQVGGIGFCLDANGKNGYYILIRTTTFAGLEKDVMIVKVNNGILTVLKDSQQSSTKIKAGIDAGVEYGVDVLLKREVQPYYNTVRNTITVFINGFKITAEDNGLDSFSGYVPARGITNNVGLHCGQGTVYFEYVYADDITEELYKKNSSRLTYEHNGVYSDDTVSMLFGDIKYNDGNTKPNNSGSLFEFGTTAREIKKTKISYDDRPAKPIGFKTSLNKYVTVLDQKIQPFGAESYVLNTSSVTVPLDDNNNTSFYVLGNSIQRSGFIDYDTDPSKDSSNQEPVIFQSTWIQSEADAKKLAEWIKASVLNKGKFVEMSVFGNPLISAGDIVKINYPILGMTESSNKYIVNRCTLEYREGLTTSISCRAI